MEKNAIVAGTGFEDRPKIIRRYCRDGQEVILIREPQNEHDKNAIAVYLVTPKLFGLMGKSNKKIGYVKANTANSLAKKMDSGVLVSASVKSFYAPKGREYPRVTLMLKY